MRKFPWMIAAALVAAPAVATAAVKTKEVTYEADGVKMKGFLAWDDAAKDKRPGVLVVHEWWGHNEHARNSARKLAKMGYVALAVDMYGDGKKAEHPDDAGKFAGQVMKNFDGAKARFVAAEALLHEDPHVDPTRTAAIGYCFGGGVVLNMARAGVDLQAVGSFHGSLGAAVPAKEIKAKLFVANGGADPFVKDEQKAAFKEEMKAAGADLTFIDYPGAVHAFTNPGATALGKKFKLPLAYDAKADKASWEAFSKFLAEALKK
ncbi:MAG: dienelactone hydrolase family protein [Myxococcales bacterium]|nr:dienelactone hydrolase family protein [Myxococcales bacterium]MCB9652412.1 dienelactone hydrolase family protein [Deltaproteobacteria bacterium]